MTILPAPSLSLPRYLPFATPRARQFLFISLPLLALLLRLIALAHLEIWNDEAHSILTATDPRGILAALRNDTNPPFYFFLLKIWSTLFGLSPFALRALSAVAGAASVAVLGLFLRRCRAPALTIVWAMSLLTLAPLQISYSQQVRGYSLACFFVTLNLYTFIRAIQSHRLRDYILHALSVALGFYTHPTLVPFAAVFWLAAPTLKLKPRDYLYLALAHILALQAYLPGLFLLFQQFHQTAGSDWIKTFWISTTPVWLLIPRSLEILFLGGPRAQVAIYPSLLGPWRLLAILLALAALTAAFWPRKTPAQKNPRPLPSFSIQNSAFRIYLPLLIIATLLPLVWILAYSLLIKPLYVLGRYDVIAQPAFLTLLAVGFARLQSQCLALYSSVKIPTRARQKFSPRAASLLLLAWLPGIIIFAIASWSLLGHWNWPLDSNSLRHSNRGQFFQGVLEPQDRIICLGLEAGPTLYYNRLYHLPAPVASFPPDTLSHIGWILTDDELIPNPTQRFAEAAAYFSQATQAHASHIWIVLDSGVSPPQPHQPLNPRQQMVQILQAAAAQSGWQQTPLDPALTTDLGLVCLHHSSEYSKK